MLWPKGETHLKARVVAAVILVLAGKAAVLVMPFAYKAVIDRMSAGTVAFGIIASLVLLVLGWVFVPFYLASGVFTMPEFLERRYSEGARWYLAIISIVGSCRCGSVVPIHSRTTTRF